MECQAFLDDKQMIKFDLSEAQVMSFECPIYEISAFYSLCELDVDNLLQLQKNSVYLFQSICKNNNKQEINY